MDSEARSATGAAIPGNPAASRKWRWRIRSAASRAPMPDPICSRGGQRSCRHGGTSSAKHDFCQMSDDGCVVGLCAGVPGPIVVEAVGDMRPAVALPFQVLEREAFLVGRWRRVRATALHGRERPGAAPRGGDDEGRGARRRRTPRPGQDGAAGRGRRARQPGLGDRRAQSGPLKTRAARAGGACGRGATGGSAPGRSSSFARRRGSG